MSCREALEVFGVNQEECVLRSQERPFHDPADPTNFANVESGPCKVYLKHVKAFTKPEAAGTIWKSTETFHGLVQGGQWVRVK